METIKRWLRQETAIAIFVIGALFVGGGVGCSLIKTPSPVTGEAVSGEQLSAEATKVQRDTNKALAEITAQIKALEVQYQAVIDEHDIMAEAFTDAYDSLEEKKAGLAAAWSQALTAVGGVVPGPWMPALGILGTLGTAAFGVGMRRKELKLASANRKLGFGPRGEAREE